MPNIQNETQLLKVMEEKARNALNNVTKEVLELFKEEYIQKYVYNSHGVNQVYHGGSGKPSGEFMEAWEWTELKSITNILITEMYYNPSNMGFDPDSYLHGSKYSNPSDVRDTLMDILNKKGYSSSLFLSVSRPVAYWEKFISDMFTSNKLNQIITKHFKKEGFVISK